MSRKIQALAVLFAYIATGFMLVYFLFLNADTQRQIFYFLQAEGQDAGLFGFLLITNILFIILLSGHHAGTLELITGYIYPPFISIPCVLLAQLQNAFSCYWITHRFLKNYADEKIKKTRLLKGLKIAMKDDERSTIFFARFAFLPAPIGNFFVPAMEVQFKNYIMYGLLGVAPKSCLNVLLSWYSRGIIDSMILGKETTENTLKEQISFYLFLVIFVTFIVYGFRLTSKIKRILRSYADMDQHTEPLLQSDEETGDEDIGNKVHVLRVQRKETLANVVTQRG